VAQVVECLPSKPEALISNPCSVPRPPKKKERNIEEGNYVQLKKQKTNRKRKKLIHGKC
jgi:hypothetical protein